MAEQDPNFAPDEPIDINDMDPPEPPVRFEIIEDELSATINIHDMRQADAPFSCWSYISEGLSNAPGQKELAILVKKEESETSKDYPTDPLGFFLTVKRFAEEGNLVLEGDITEFGEDGFLNPQFRALAYVKPLGLYGAEQNENLLSCILLTQDELKIARRFGLTRVVSLLGYSHNHYPCPPWTDRGRDSVISDQLTNDMEDSILAKVPLFGMPGARVQLSANQLSINCKKGTAEYLKGVLEQLPEEAPFVVATELDPDANAMLVWQKTMEKGPSAITPPGSDGSRVTGCSVMIFPEQEESNAQVIEDSFLLSLKTPDWITLRKGLTTGTKAFINTPGGGVISVSWYESTDPVPELKPRSISDLPMIEHFDGLGKVTNAKLLSEEETVVRSTDPVVFMQFVEAVEMTVLGYFTDRVPEEKRELNLTCHLKPGNEVEWEISSEQDEDKLELKGIELRLGDLPLPSVDEETVSFSLEFLIKSKEEYSGASS